MSDYPMLISNKLHSFRNFSLQYYIIEKTEFRYFLCTWTLFFLNI